MSDEARIITTKNGECYFEQGDVRFNVDPDNLCRVLGAAEFSEEGSVLDKLSDSTLITLARANGLDTSPYVRRLILEPLRGLVQIVWYRDVQGHRSDHLDKNQQLRLAQYTRRLAAWRPDDDGTGGGETGGDRRPKKKEDDHWSRSFKVLPGRHKMRGGREHAVFEIIKQLKEPTFAQIMEQAKTRVKTKSKLEPVVGYFVNCLVKKGIVEQIKRQK